MARSLHMDARICPLTEAEGAYRGARRDGAVTGAWRGRAVGITDKGMECIAMDCGKTTGPVPAKRSTIVIGSPALVSILALVATMLFPTWLFAQEATGAEVSAISELHVIPGHEAAV
jgi:hypothetical protein